MQITGEITEIIYQNEINSYTIAVFETEEEEITIVGYLPFILVGDTLNLIGKYVMHQEYGRQFKVDTFEKIMPKTLSALERYLANGTIKGIGESTAKKIIKTFGEDTISVFKFEPEKLAQIKGITKTKAIEMAQTFNENWELWQLVGFLDRFGISASQAKNVYKELGLNAIAQIEENPYLFVDLTRGVDFKQIDKMALEIGIPQDNVKRIKSGIKYSLLRVSYNGHTCVLKDNLVSFVQDLLGVSKQDVEDNIINLNVEGKIVVEDRENEEKWVYLSTFYNAEEYIAERIIKLMKSTNMKRIEKISGKLKKTQIELDLELSEKQQEAIEMVNDNNVSIITGGPGTGKTTIIKAIIDLYEKEGKKVVLCAPTGRAAKRMSEATNKEAKTLHRLLEIGKIQDEGIDSAQLDIAPLDADIVIIDEVSMVDLFLMNYVLKALYLGTKLILVGDADQLASVGPGSVLEDMIKCEKIPTVHLDKIFRQAAMSKIVVNAHRVNSGEKFIGQEQAKEEKVRDDFFYIKKLDQEEIIKEVISLCKGRLQNYGDYDFFKNIQVISPTKKGVTGTKELNKVLQQELNPSSESKQEKQIMGVIFRKGDRIMQIKNNYDIYWERKTPTYENGSGVFNGEYGTIEKIDEEERQVKIKFDDEKVAWYGFSELEQIEHAYAITIHKAQGSEFDVVIVPVVQSSPILLTRNLLYTAITRAKKLLIIIGSDRIIQFMIQNTDTKKRNTGLEYKMSH